MIDVILASMTTALIVSFLTFLMSVVAFRRNLAARTEIMGLRKEIAILAGTLEAHFLCNPTRPDDDKTKTEMIILRNLFIQFRRCVSFPWYSVFRARRIRNTFNEMYHRYETLHIPDDNQHMPDRREFSRKMVESLQKFIMEL